MSKNIQRACKKNLRPFRSHAIDSEESVGHKNIKKGLADFFTDFYFNQLIY